MRHRLVLLDRDGVINRDSSEYIKSVEDWHVLPGALEAIADLCEAGIEVVVISNQSGVGRGLFTESTLEGIHAHMRAQIEAAGGRLSGIYFCPHRPDAGCDCRKPRPGLLLRAARDFNIEPSGVPFIGDKISDAEAAIAAGARPILVGTRTTAQERRALAAPVEAYDDLAAAAAQLLAELLDNKQ